MWFAMFAAVLGVGNGLSSGILLTLGADVAPEGRPGAVPRLVAHAHRRGRRGLAAARLGASRRSRRCRSRPASIGRRRPARRARVRAVGAEVRAAGESMMQFCRSRNDGRRCTRELGHRGLHRHRTIMWTDAGADDPHCPGSGSPGTAAPTLANGFPGGRAVCPDCLGFVALDPVRPAGRARHVERRIRSGSSRACGVVQHARMDGCRDRHRARKASFVRADLELICTCRWGAHIG